MKEWHGRFTTVLFKACFFFEIWLFLIVVFPKCHPRIFCSQKHLKESVRIKQFLSPVFQHFFHDVVSHVTLPSPNFSLGYRDFILGYRDSSLGYKDFSLGYKDFPLGYRDFSLGYRDFPLGYRDFLLGYRYFSLGYRDFSYIF